MQRRDFVTSVLVGGVVTPITVRTSGPAPHSRTTVIAA
jgi:hypothetical protein